MRSGQRGKNVPKCRTFQTLVQKPCSVLSDESSASYILRGGVGVRSANGVPVGAKTFDKPGDYAFTKPVPAEALDQKIAKVEFRLDKAIAAGEIETRELGLVATSVALK